MLAEWGSHAVWGNGHVLYTGADRRVHRVAESGGPSSPVTTIDMAAGETRHVALQFLPGGRRVLLSAPEFNESRARVHIASVDGDERTPVPGVLGVARYEAGHLFYIQDGTLVARRFDPATALFSGETVPLADSVDDFTVSRDTLVARHRDVTGRTMAWSDGRGSAGTPVGPLCLLLDQARHARLVHALDSRPRRGGVALRVGCDEAREQLLTRRVAAPLHASGARDRRRHLGPAAHRRPQANAAHRHELTRRRGDVLTPDGTIMRVPVSLTGRAVRAGTPAPWLKAPGLFAHLSFVLSGNLYPFAVNRERRRVPTLNADAVRTVASNAARLSEILAAFPLTSPKCL